MTRMDARRGKVSHAATGPTVIRPTFHTSATIRLPFAIKEAYA